MSHVPDESLPSGGRGEAALRRSKKEGRVSHGFREEARTTHRQLSLLCEVVQTQCSRAQRLRIT